MNQPLTASLRFDELFAVVASAWPSDMRLVRRDAYNGGYLIENLDIDAGDAFIGAPDEVLMRNLFDAVYEALHAWGDKHDRVRPLEMGEQTRPRFERRLRDITERAASGDWRPSDHALIRRYFDVNAQAA